MNELAISDASILADDLIAQNRFYYTAADFQLQLVNGFQHGKTPGETSYMKSLDDMFTLRPGFLYCFTGWPGSGKSEFLTQLAVLQAQFRKRKICFYSPESYPIEEFIDTIIHCYLGKSTDRRFPNVCSPDEYLQAIKWVDEHFFFCDWKETPDASEALRAFEYFKKEKGVEIFIVDPFNSLVTEGEERNLAIGLKRNLTAFKRFAAQNKAMVWIVEHPKTPADTKEFDQIPGPRHLFGGTMWWNKVDVLATVHRPNHQDKGDPTVQFKTWKIKNQKLNGRPGEEFIYFDIRTNRYYPTNSFNRHPMLPELPAGNWIPYKEPEEKTDETPF
jgi:twinkle protein